MMAKVVVPNDKPFFTVDDVAEIFNTHRNTIYRWIEEKLIPEPYKVHEGDRAPQIYTREQVVDFAKNLKRQRSGPATKPEYLAKYEQTREALEQAARQTADPQLAKRAGAIIMVCEGERRKDVNEKFGITQTTLYDWLNRWVEGGVEALIF